MRESWQQQARELKTSTYALYLAARHPRVPWYAKAIAALVVAYAFSPIDLIPDFIPVLGYLDDLVLLPLGIALILKMIPPPVWHECQEKARAESQPGRPRSWVAAVIIVAMWLLMLALGVGTFWRCLQ